MARRHHMDAERAATITAELTTRADLRDFDLFCEKYLRVLNRAETSGIVGATKLVPFIMNPVQRRFADMILDKWEKGEPARFIVLKARRMGISTVVVALMVWHILTNKHRNAFVIAHNDKATTNVFSMAKKMVDYMPSLNTGGKEDLRPARRYDNREELWLVHPTDQQIGHDCRFMTVVATNEEAVRSFESHLLHGSEVAFWPNAGKLLAGALQTMSDLDKTLVVLESTANGAGGYFHDEFWKHYSHVDSRGRKVISDWVSLFFSWWSMPYYKRDLPEDLPWKKFLREYADDELRRMVAEYNLTPEQGYWAYRICVDKCRGDWSKFKQEYPGKPEEAFAHSAFRVFEENQVADSEKQHQRPPMWRGTLSDGSYDPVEADRGRLPDWEDMAPGLHQGEADEEPLWVWSLPEPGRSYVVALDPSSGESAGDYAAYQVLDFISREQVAEMHCRAMIHQLAYFGVMLSMVYNQAMFSWEVTGLGRAVSTAVMQTNYPFLFMRTPMDQRSGEMEDKRPGWHTNHSSKPTMIMYGQQEFERGAIIHSGRLFGEIRSLREGVRSSAGAEDVVAGEDLYRKVKVGAAVGAYDDLVMAWLQALAVINSGMYNGGEESMYLSTGRKMTHDEKLETAHDEWLEEMDRDFGSKRPDRAVGKGWT